VGVPVDRELLRQPVDHLRHLLAANEVEVYDAPDWLKAQVRAQFRFDLASMGVDHGSPEQLEGAVVGYAVALKALLTFVVPPQLIAQFVTLFDCVEPILDEDLDAEASALLGEWRPPIASETTRDAILGLARAQGVDVPEGAVVFDLSGLAEGLSGMQPDLRLDTEWQIERRDDGLIEATHVATGQGVVAPTLPELGEQMRQYLALVVQTPEDAATGLSLGGEAPAPDEDVSGTLTQVLDAMGAAVDGLRALRDRLAP
jgi:hypothetical protein